MSIVLPEGGVIRGVGTDLIECERIARVLERQRDRFLKRVFTEGEREYSMKMKNPVPHLAARLARRIQTKTSSNRRENGWQEKGRLEQK